MSAIGTQRHTGVVVGVWFALQNGSLKTLPRIIHGREQECLPSAALSLYPEGPKVPFRISSLGPCEPAILPQEAPILELLRWSAALSDPLRVVQVGAVVIALDFLPLGTWARALIFLLPWRVQRAPTSVAVSTTSKSWENHIVPRTASQSDQHQLHGDLVPDCVPPAREPFQARSCARSRTRR